jgi:hypothetical protein
MPPRKPPGCRAERSAQRQYTGAASTARPAYLIVACTVITDVPEAFGPLPVALIAKVSLPLYRALVFYS